jgi:hypothetical protein
MKNHDASERHQNNNLKAIVSYFKFLRVRSAKEINAKEDIPSFLQTKIKSKEDDPDRNDLEREHQVSHSQNNIDVEPIENVLDTIFKAESIEK